MMGGLRGRPTTERPHSWPGPASLQLKPRPGPEIHQLLHTLFSDMDDGDEDDES